MRSRRLATAFLLTFAAGCAATGDRPRPAGGAGPSEVRTKVALVHFNPSLADMARNIRTVTGLVRRAIENGARVVVTPELTLSGYSLTEADVQTRVGTENPFPELAELAELAKAHGAYVVVGVAERLKEDRPRNSAIVLGPTGLLGVQRKRATSEWHARGDTPIQVFETPFGDIAPVICSDAYLPDVVRMAAIEGADIIAAPSNWWGQPAPLEIWRSRAIENGVWFVAANRWGQERDTRHPGAACKLPCDCNKDFGEQCLDGTCQYVYDMSDAPSAVIAPDGRVVAEYRSRADAVASDRIIYATIAVPRSRLGRSPSAMPLLVRERRPAAYEALANGFYLPDTKTPAPGLPPGGPMHVGVVAGPIDGVEGLRRLVEAAQPRPNVLVLPGLAMGTQPYSREAIESGQGGWGELQEMASAIGLELVATTALVRGIGHGTEELVLIRRGRHPEIHAAIHGDGHGKPEVVDLSQLRVGVSTGCDWLFPEVSTSLAKSGVDVALVTSQLAVGLCSGLRLDAARLLQEWRLASHLFLSVVASDASGLAGISDANNDSVPHEQVTAVGEPLVVVRTLSRVAFPKAFNHYYDFDLRTLVSRTTPDGWRAGAPIEPMPAGHPRPEHVR